MESVFWSAVLLCVLFSIFSMFYAYSSATGKITCPLDLASISNRNINLLMSFLDTKINLIASFSVLLLLLVCCFIYTQDDLIDALAQVGLSLFVAFVVLYISPLRTRFIETLPYFPSGIPIRANSKDAESFLFFYEPLKHRFTCHLSPAHRGRLSFSQMTSATREIEYLASFAPVLIATPWSLKRQIKTISASGCNVDQLPSIKLSDRAARIIADRRKKNGGKSKQLYTDMNRYLISK